MAQAKVGKIDQYILGVVGGAIRIQGNWNANTNTPDITGATTTGFAWIVSVAGTTNLGGINKWEIGDLAVKTESGWAKIDNQDYVTEEEGDARYAKLDGATFTGDISAPNLSGINTGDQDLSSYLTEETDPLSLHLDQSDDPQTIIATDTTITASDELYFGDVTDSSKIKKDTVQGILDLVPSPDLSIYAQLSGAIFTGSISAPKISSDMGFNINAVKAPANGSITATVAPGGDLTASSEYIYGVYYKTAEGVTKAGQSAHVFTDETNKSFNLVVPVSPDHRVTSRVLCRTKAGAPYEWWMYELTTINDNTTTTYYDTASDASMTGSPQQGYESLNTTTKFITLNGARAMTLDGNGTFFGANAGRDTTGSMNTFIGAGAGLKNTTGTQNVALGQLAMGNGVTTGSYNVSLSAYSGWSLTSGYANLFVGIGAGQWQTDGYNNIFIGDYAGQLKADGGQTAHNYECILLGSGTRTSGTNSSNEIVIGKAAVGMGSNSVNLGGPEIANTYLHGYVYNQSDSYGSVYGAGNDAIIYYDGTNLILNPKLTGSGYLNIQGQTLLDDKIMFTQTDGNEYIDSLADGYMDYGATTAHRFLADVKLTADNRKLYFGTADDASIYYNGTDLYIHPRAVGSGKVYIPGYTVNSSLAIGTLEFQSYSLNNSWFGDNVYFNGTNFIRRATGSVGMFCFQGNEGQFRFSPSGAAGSIASTSGSYVQMKTSSDGRWGLGGASGSAISTETGVFTGSQIYKNADGDLFLKLDSQKLYFGAGDDASITYNGTNMLINPKEVGSGMLDVAGTIQTDGYNSAAGNAGISTTFLDADGNTITVENGLITAKTAP